MRPRKFISLTILAALALDAAGEPGLPSLPGAVDDGDFHENGKPAAAKVELGRLLFFDKILSGNRNTSCATCHHPQHATSDGVALGFGEGARGLGPNRRPGASHSTAVHERVPRNSPALFNLGAREFRAMFHDGRVEQDPKGYYEGGFITPARWKLPQGLENLLAAQAMFPVTSPTEMAGHKGENEIADAKALNRAAGPQGVWELLAQRLRAVPVYVKAFRRAFPRQIKSAGDITFVHAANAIAAFEATAFRADGSPFDRYLRGTYKLKKQARAGMKLFYGVARCADCHSGKFQTDHEFHAIAMPQIGPGKSDGTDASYWNATGIQAFVEDHGRGRVTSRTKDDYRFRTPSLRNVELTGPWGHAGSYDKLEDVIRHHLAPVESLNQYRAPQGLLPPMGRVMELSARRDRMRHTYLTPSRQQGFARRDTWVQSQASLREKIAGANELARVELSRREIRQLVAFLKALTDPRSKRLERLVPKRVPSGLPVED